MFVSQDKKYKKLTMSMNQRLTGKIDLPSEVYIPKMLIDD